MAFQQCVALAAATRVCRAERGSGALSILTLVFHLFWLPWAFLRLGP